MARVVLVYKCFFSHVKDSRASERQSQSPFQHLYLTGVLLEDATTNPLQRGYKTCPRIGIKSTTTTLG